MGDADGRLCLVDVLAACAAGTVGVDLQVLGVNLHLDLVRLRQHRYSDGGGVDTALGLGLGHALNAVHARLKFKFGVRSVAVDREADLLVAAKLGGVGV